MTDISAFTGLAKLLGFPALIFAMWYLYHKATVEQMNRIIETNFNLLRQMIEQMSVNSGLLASIREKIDSNQWCPYLKNIQKRRKEDNESDFI
jgi:Fe2+ transport system protein B